MRDYERTAQDRAMDIQSDGVGLADPHRILPEMYQSVHPSVLQVHAYLFGICAPGVAETWSFQGTGTGHLARLEM